MSALSDPAMTAPGRVRRVLLLGNPNTGKTTLFNRLCGIRSKTANFPGSTVEAHIGVATAPGVRYEITDLPGHYGLNLERPESQFCKAYLAGRVPQASRPEAVLVVADATNLARNLIFVSQALPPSGFMDWLRAYQVVAYPERRDRRRPFRKKA